jgi:hypothetical protein
MEKEDQELVDKIEQGVMMNNFVHSPEWTLIQSACDRLVEKATSNLILIPANEQVRIIELQCIIKLYKNVLSSLVNSYIKEGEIAFNERKDM